ncbi:MAG: response regulator, partial [Thermoanaerobaculales bacterium]|nr:response regulator [Thermoanaerobaculales bacterium]
DDDAMIRGLAPRMLERLGFQAITAADGEEALEIFRDRAEDISCVLLDLTMPRMGGEETFAAMRQVKADVPVILTSGYNEQFVTEGFSGKGLAGFLQKPFVVEALARVLREVLED